MNISYSFEKKRSSCLQTSRNNNVCREAQPLCLRSCACLRREKVSLRGQKKSEEHADMTLLGLACRSGCMKAPYECHESLCYVLVHLGADLEERTGELISKVFALLGRHRAVLVKIALVPHNHKHWLRSRKSCCLAVQLCYRRKGLWTHNAIDL